MKLMNDSVELEEKIRSTSFMGYEEYAESELLPTGIDDCSCYKCKERNTDLTYCCEIDYRNFLKRIKFYYVIGKSIRCPIHMMYQHHYYSDAF